MLIIFDMDGTLIEHRNTWLELHRRLGTEKEGMRATEEWLTKDYDKLVDIVIHNMWKGKLAQPFLDLIDEARLMTGAKETIDELKRRGFEVALITTAPKLLMERVMQDLGIEHGVANHLEIKDGKITGRSRHDDGTTMFPVRDNDKVPSAEKLCQELGSTMEDVVAVGDGPSDRTLFDAAGTSIAFNAHQTILADHNVEGTDLRKILDYL